MAAHPGCRFHILLFDYDIGSWAFLNYGNDSGRLSKVSVYVEIDGQVRRHGYDRSWRLVFPSDQGPSWAAASQLIAITGNLYACIAIHR